MEKPDLRPRRMALSVDYANKLLGVEFTPDEVKKLLERMRYGAEVGGRELSVLVPAYRTDVLHPIDLVEDVAIAHGYLNFRPREDSIKLRGKLGGETAFAQKLREAMIGLGFQEAMTLVMTNKKNLFERMLKNEEPVAEAASAVASEHSVARNWLLPSLLTVLETNKNNEYPQKFFEAGSCVSGEGKDSYKLAAVIAHSKTSYSGIKAAALGLYEAAGAEHTLKPAKHLSFIEGRCAQTPEGFYGEIHPQVLVNFGLEVPVTALEFDMGLLAKNAGK